VAARIGRGNRICRRLLRHDGDSHRDVRAASVASTHRRGTTAETHCGTIAATTVALLGETPMSSADHRLSRSAPRAVITTLVAALVVAITAVLALAGSSVAAEAKGGPDPLVITGATPTPGATDVASGAGTGAVELTFSADLRDFPKMSVVDDRTATNLVASASFNGDASTLTIWVQLCSPNGQVCDAAFTPDTTYTVTLGGSGKYDPVVSADGALLAGSDIGGIEVGKGIATYTFTTAPAA
jgi:hypothetical protein